MAQRLCGLHAGKAARARVHVCAARRQPAALRASARLGPAVTGELLEELGGHGAAPPTQVKACRVLLVLLESHLPRCVRSDTHATSPGHSKSRAAAGAPARWSGGRQTARARHPCVTSTEQQARTTQLRCCQRGPVLRLEERLPSLWRFKLGGGRLRRAAPKSELTARSAWRSAAPGRVHRELGVDSISEVDWILPEPLEQQLQQPLFALRAPVAVSARTRLHPRRRARTAAKSLLDIAAGSCGGTVRKAGRSAASGLHAAAGGRGAVACAHRKDFPGQGRHELFRRAKVDVHIQEGVLEVLRAIHAGWSLPGSAQSRPSQPRGPFRAGAPLAGHVWLALGRHTRHATHA